MKKTGTSSDENRRHKVSQLMDGKDWKKNRSLPPTNNSWPTCLIIAPSSVVGNWEGEFDTWGYFEIGCYIGPRQEREVVLKDFRYGRLDVGQLSPALIWRLEILSNSVTFIGHVSLSMKYIA
ncbi:hypothetical protein D9758_015003 [Tetrapyrgos nigripes]|uniref:Uncharacterized protein n=1 Tax=Tetrapyrgos nigripes TaxID=182062 RepID=A0A8H5FKH2_9AGAR|nr:hypothetical protein D9758_015003 [Tetrapyrgos nigripes]